MLLSFTFDNYHSFSDMTEFSMVAGPTKRHADHITEECGSPVLGMTAIYGANAAGKSSFIGAMYTSRKFITKGIGGRESRGYCRCDPTNKTRSTNFDYLFTYNNRLFQFGFEVMLSEGKIMSEWLYETVGGSPMVIYTAELVDGEYRYSYPSFNEICQNTLDIFSESLKEKRNKTLITELSDKKFKENQQELEIFHEVFSWFKNKLWINRIGSPTTDDDLMMISGHLSRYDTDIASARFELEKDANLKMSEEDKESLEEGKVIPQKGFKVVKEDGNVNVYGVHMIHGSCNESFNYFEESNGTQRASQLCGTLFDDDNKDCTFVFDEFGIAMHPIVVKSMVEDFLKISNRNRNQLIMATHHTGIMTLDIFRRDEIWFIEKKNGYSEMYSLEDFESKVRVDIALQKAYLEGRFGALPVCREIEDRRVD